MKHPFVAFLGPYSLSTSLCVILPPALPFLMSLTSEQSTTVGWGGGGESILNGFPRRYFSQPRTIIEKWHQEFIDTNPLTRAYHFPTEKIKEDILEADKAST